MPEGTIFMFTATIIASAIIIAVAVMFVTRRNHSKTELAAVLDFAGDRIVDIMTHVRPDGDAVGSIVATAIAFAKRTRLVRVYVDMTSIGQGRFLLERLAALGTVSVLDAASRPSNSPATCVVVVDCGDSGRVAGWRETDFKRFVVNVDHHGNELFGTVNVVDKAAASKL